MTTLRHTPDADDLQEISTEAGSSIAKAQPETGGRADKLRESWLHMAAISFVRS